MPVPVQQQMPIPVMAPPVMAAPFEEDEPLPF
jgi:hypothetical protein